MTTQTQKMNAWRSYICRATGVTGVCRFHSRAANAGPGIASATAAIARKSRWPARISLPIMLPSKSVPRSSMPQKARNISMDRSLERNMSPGACCDGCAAFSRTSPSESADEAQRADGALRQRYRALFARTPRKIGDERRRQTRGERRDVVIDREHLGIDTVRDPAGEGETASVDRKRRQQRVVEAAEPDPDDQEHRQ